MVSSVVPALWGVPAMRHEGACASASLAILPAMAEIEAGRYDCVLVAGVELERNVPGALAAQHLRWREPKAKPSTLHLLLLDTSGSMRQGGRLARAKGYAAQVLEQAWKDAPSFAAAACSASPMWAANAATVTPSADAGDGRVHFTPANLHTNHPEWLSHFSLPLRQGLYWGWT